MSFGLIRRCQSSATVSELKTTSGLACVLFGISGGGDGSLYPLACGCRKIPGAAKLGFGGALLLDLLGAAWAVQRLLAARW